MESAVCIERKHWRSVILRSAEYLLKNIWFTSGDFFFNPRSLVPCKWGHCLTWRIPLVSIYIEFHFRVKMFSFKWTREFEVYEKILLLVKTFCDWFSHNSSPNEGKKRKKVSKSFTFLLACHLNLNWDSNSPANLWPVRGVPILFLMWAGIGSSPLVSPDWKKHGILQPPCFGKWLNSTWFSLCCTASVWIIYVCYAGQMHPQP